MCKMCDINVVTVLFWIEKVAKKAELQTHIQRHIISFDLVSSVLGASSYSYSSLFSFILIITFFFFCFLQNILPLIYTCSLSLSLSLTYSCSCATVVKCVTCKCVYAFSIKFQSIPDRLWLVTLTFVVIVVVNIFCPILFMQIR